MTKSNLLDLARECGAAGAWTSKFYENVAVFSLTELDAFAERIRAEKKQAAIDAPEPSGERAALIEKLRRNVDYLDGTQVLIGTMQEAADMLAADASEQEPMFWVRIRSDGMYEGPIHNARIEEVRKQSGAWKPLYLAPPAPQARELSGEHLSDALSKSMRVLEAVDVYHERPDRINRTALRTVIMDEFEAALLAARSKP